LKDRDFKSGFVTILGRPNVGKSTLLNAVIGEKVSIVTSKPQTTRNRISGIKNIENAQIVFWDTPGIHKAKDFLNRIMVKAAISTISEVDVIIFMVDGSTPSGKGDEFIISLLKEIKQPVLLVINKIDLVDKGKLLPLIEDFSKKFGFSKIIPVSAATGDGVNILLTNITELLEAGPRYFAEDIITEKPERFIVSEMIREKIFALIKDEVPYSTAVEIEEFKDKKKRNIVVISAAIYVERSSQKKIIIGKKGSMIKKIGSQARKDIEVLLGTRVFLELFVKVRSEWKNKGSILKDLGLD